MPTTCFLCVTYTVFCATARDNGNSGILIPVVCTHQCTQMPVHDSSTRRRGRQEYKNTHSAYIAHNAAHPRARFTHASGVISEQQQRGGGEPPASSSSSSSSRGPPPPPPPQSSRVTPSDLIPSKRYVLLRGTNCGRGQRYRITDLQNCRITELQNATAEQLSYCPKDTATEASRGNDIKQRRARG